MPGQWPRQTTAELIAFYGNPDANYDGTPDPKWEAENLVYIVPPYAMYWSWNGKPVQKIRVHKKCAQAFLRILTNIGKSFTCEERKKYQLDQCGGGYTFRLMRGLNALSIHSYGAALDIGPSANPLGKRWTPNSQPPMIPLKAVDIFRAEGLVWGGDWNGNKVTTDQTRHDAMHIQAAVV